MNTVFVARQPIFDRRQRLYAYELLYRRDGDIQTAGPEDRALMSAQVIVSALLDMGADSMLGDAKAFVNVARDHLVSDAWRLFDRERVIIELLETVECDDETVDACRRLVAEGYTLALDDYEFRPETARFLDLASIIKVDVLGADLAELETRIATLPRRPLTLLAERVESADIRDRCIALGFELFQGYFFSRPETLTNQTVAPGALAATRLLNLLADPDTSDAELEAALASDVGMCYKLLRMVNSASIGGRGVESIGHALRLVGRQSLHRWVSLILVAGLGAGSDLRREQATTAITRARMCELLARAAGAHRDPGNAFVAGMVSLLDTMLEMPMSIVAAQLSLAQDVANAVVDREGPVAAPLMVTEAFESGAWSSISLGAAELGIEEKAVPQLYFDALRWARQSMAIA